MRYQQPLGTTLAFLLSMIPATSQVLEKRVTPVDNNQALKFSKADTVGVAILVGVGKYPRYSNLSELHFPAVDVDTLAATLKSQRYMVLTLKDADATKGSILNAIQQAGEAMAGENLTAIFFFSGHGFAVSGENYLATQDTDSRNFAASGLSVKAVEDELIKTKASRRVMWIDACREEPGKGVAEARTFANFQASAGTRLLLSTKAGKVSYEDEELKQGIFSYYLTKGLQGEAAGPDGLITFQDLATYVTLKVRSRSLETGHVQIPYEAGEASGDFLLAGGSLAADAARPARRACVDPPPGLVGWWPGDRDATDIVGSNNPSGLNAATLVSGRVSNGFQFGNSGYVEIPPSPNLANQQFTWSAWVRPDGPSNSRGNDNFVINQDIDATHASVLVGWNSADSRFYFRSGGQQDPKITSTHNFPSGAFYFLTASYDGDIFRLFVDGNPEGSLSARKVVPYSAKPWMIGSGDRGFFAGGWTHTWNGVIDELQAFNRALSPAEIQAIYNAAGAGECKPGMH